MVRLSRIKTPGLETETIPLNILMVSFLVIIAVECLRGYVSPFLHISPIMIIGLTRFIEIVLILSIVYKLKNMKSIGLAQDQIFPGLIRGMIWSLGFGLFVSIGFILLIFFSINPLVYFQTKMPTSGPDIMIYYLVGGILASVSEEIFFRGILYGYFRQWGIYAAIGFSTIIFAVAHPGMSHIQISGGILFAAAYEFEKKLMVPIVIHALGNTALFSISYLSKWFLTP